MVKAACPHPNLTCGSETQPPFGQSSSAQAELEPLASAPEGEGAKRVRAVHLQLQEGRTQDQGRYSLGIRSVLLIISVPESANSSV